MSDCGCDCHQEKLHQSWVRAVSRYGSTVDKESGCWRWNGNVDPVSGYARFASKEYAHRQAYIEAYGPIPEGLCIDHVWDRGCRHRDCVNPEHLEAVSNVVNIQRGHAKRTPVTECLRGHEFTEKNTYIDARGHRVCRICRQYHVDAFRERQAASKDGKQT